MQLHIRVIDDNHFEELFATRTELHTEAPVIAGQVAVEGRAVFHTEWLLYSYGNLRARSLGPRLEHSFNSLLPRTWSVPIEDGEFFQMPTALLMASIKTAFVTIANESLLPPPIPALPAHGDDQPVVAPMSESSDAR